MTIDKIISGGRPGAESAAIEVALRLHLAYEGLAGTGEDRAAAYGLEERPFASRVSEAEANLDLAEGALVMTVGGPSGELARILEAVRRRGLPHYLVDLGSTAPFQAGVWIHDWIGRSGVRVLFVTGAGAEEAPAIAETANKALYTAIMLGMGAPPEDRRSEDVRQRLPKTVEEAVGFLVEALPLKDRVTIARMDPGEIHVLNSGLGHTIRKAFRLDSGNRPLAADCAKIAGRAVRDPAETSEVILRELALALAKTHRLRAV